MYAYMCMCIYIYIYIYTIFNFTHRLPEIRNPVLLTHGRYDTMRPPVVDAMYRKYYYYYYYYY